MKRVIAIILSALMVVMLFTACGNGLFGLTQSEDTGQPEEAATGSQVEEKDPLDEAIDRLGEWYGEYEAFANALSEEHSVFKLITPKYLETLPDRLDDLVDTYIFPEEEKQEPTN